MENLYNLFIQTSSVCTDTRNILPDSLFFCLKGENFDGNEFALAALERGAKYVVTERKDLENHPQCVVVNDVLETLQQLSLYHRRQLTIPVLGITGTNGKTTTKELISAVLSKKFKTAFTKGNLNNHIGVPLTLLSIKSDDEIAVVEMGANHPGEIAQLCRFVEPDFGLITNIGKAHIEGFGSAENIVLTKKAVYDAVMAKGGELFVNADDSLLLSLVKDYDKVNYYGNKTSCEGKVVEMNPYLLIDFAGKKVQTHLTGNYNINNMLAAGAGGTRFGVSVEKIVEALSEYCPTNNRSQIIKSGTNTLIADFYNANPTSMNAAIDNLFAIKAAKKLAVLGDMRELGVESAVEHRKIVEKLQQLQIPALFVGPEFVQCENVGTAFATVNELNDYLRQNKIESTLVLVKGSRGIHLENAVIE
ncbi:MAG: UDP-N-acetylmuramoyl-tripeptide--D-alanyl-D-alanine ligase [Bacteroidales bacterium]|nr:UDP-N-acetylmuramoyl-tripeptide--D-alanyl-D-alanine ligase [Bacteroidales bacterium]